MFRRLFASVIFVAFASVQAQAGQVVVRYTGVTSGAYLSTFGTNTPIADGTSFQIDTVISGVPVSIPFPGFGVYAPTAINFQVGGSSFSVANSLIGGYSLFLIDPTNPFVPGYSLVDLQVNSQGADMGSYFTTATPSFSATAPTPTVFSGYLAGSAGNLVPLATSGNGTVSGSIAYVLAYKQSVGFNVSIIDPSAAVPEPTTVVSAVIGAVGSVVMLRRRNFKTA